MWILKGVINGTFFQEVWQTQDGAIARRESRLKDKRVKDTESATGFRTVPQLGWTAIVRKREARNAA